MAPLDRDFSDCEFRVSIPNSVSRPASCVAGATFFAFDADADKMWRILLETRAMFPKNRSCMVARRRTRG